MTTQSVHSEPDRQVRGGRGGRSLSVRAAFASFAVAVGATFVGGLSEQARADGGVRPTVAVPAYFWDNAQWDRLLIGASEVDYVVLNPESGPGTVKYPTFATKVAVARVQGAMVLGYVDTSYGTRSASAVRADIDRYRSWYGVNAFFFDQTPSACSELPYYETLSTYVKAQPNGFVFHNPGTNPEECYLTAADVVVNFEGSESTYATWTPSAYTSSYPASRFWHIVYSVDPTHGSQLLDAAQARNGGLVYLTEQNMPNPFSVIATASLWSAQTPSVITRPAAPQAGTASTTPGRPAAPQSGPTTTTTTTAPPASSPGVDAPTTVPSTMPSTIPTTIATVATTVATAATPPIVVVSSSTVASTTSTTTAPPVAALLVPADDALAPTVAALALYSASAPSPSPPDQTQVPRSTSTTTVPVVAGPATVTVSADPSLPSIGVPSGAALRKKSVRRTNLQSASRSLPIVARATKRR